MRARVASDTTWCAGEVPEVWFALLEQAKTAT